MESLSDKRRYTIKMHKKIMSRAAKDLTKDAKHYEVEAKHAKSKTKKMHDKVEKKEADKGAKVMKKMARKAHEY